MKLPLIARAGRSGVWIEDADGVTIADLNPLLNPTEAAEIAELLATGANKLHWLRNHARRIAPLGAEGGRLGGRPRRAAPQMPDLEAAQARQAESQARKKAEEAIAPPPREDKADASED